MMAGKTKLFKMLSLFLLLSIFQTVGASSKRNNVKKNRIIIPKTNTKLITSKSSKPIKDHDSLMLGDQAVRFSSYSYSYSSENDQSEKIDSLLENNTAFENRESDSIVLHKLESPDSPVVNTPISETSYSFSYSSSSSSSSEPEKPEVFVHLEKINPLDMMKTVNILAPTNSGVSSDSSYIENKQFESNYRHQSKVKHHVNEHKPEEKISHTVHSQSLSAGNENKTEISILLDKVKPCIIQISNKHGKTISDSYVYLEKTESVISLDEFAQLDEIQTKKKSSDTSHSYYFLYPIKSVYLEKTKPLIIESDNDAVEIIPSRPHSPSSSSSSENAYPEISATLNKIEPLDMQFVDEKSTVSSSHSLLTDKNSHTETLFSLDEANKSPVNSNSQFFPVYEVVHSIDETETSDYADYEISGNSSEESDTLVAIGAEASVDVSDTSDKESDNIVEGKELFFEKKKNGLENQFDKFEKSDNKEIRVDVEESVSEYTIELDISVHQELEGRNSELQNSNAVVSSASVASLDEKGHETPFRKEIDSLKNVNELEIFIEQNETLSEVGVLTPESPSEREIELKLTFDETESAIDEKVEIKVSFDEVELGRANKAPENPNVESETSVKKTGPVEIILMESELSKNTNELEIMESKSIANGNLEITVAVGTFRGNGSVVHNIEELPIPAENQTKLEIIVEEILTESAASFGDTINLEVSSKESEGSNRVFESLPIALETLDLLDGASEISVVESLNLPTDKKVDLEISVNGESAAGTSDKIDLESSANEFEEGNKSVIKHGTGESKTKLEVNIKELEPPGKAKEFEVIVKEQQEKLLDNGREVSLKVVENSGTFKEDKLEIVVSEDDGASSSLTDEVKTDVDKSETSSITKLETPVFLGEHETSETNSFHQSESPHDERETFPIDNNRPTIQFSIDGVENSHSFYENETDFLISNQYDENEVSVDDLFNEDINLDSTTIFQQEKNYYCELAQRLCQSNSRHCQAAVRYCESSLLAPQKSRDVSLPDSYSPITL